MAGSSLSGGYMVFFRAPGRLGFLFLAIILLATSACLTRRTVLLGQKTRKFSRISGRTG